MALKPLDPREVLGLERSQLPGHVAIIMDGNGRWAQQRGQPRTLGHHQGAETVDRVATLAARLGIGQLTLYAFSTENWQRSRDETDALMRLYAEFLRSRRGKILDNEIRFRQIGRRDRLPPDVLQQVEQVEQQTRDSRGMTLCLAVDYGGRQEIVDAVKTICQQVLVGHLHPDQIDQDVIADALYTSGMPEPDLLIRTAGGMRLSNFLLWQVSYAELHVTQVLWPDFAEEDFYTALREYAQRERRFGRAPDTG
jgi:undecaprenyl diphosphate synthase